MTNHEFGAKLLTRTVLPDLAGIGEDRNCLQSRTSVPDYRRVGLQCGKKESEISLTRGVICGVILRWGTRSKPSEEPASV
jgi:hypothetical protein